MENDTIRTGPGKAYRRGVSLIELFEMFPDEDSARTWLENLRWPDGQRECPRCWSERTHVVKSGKPMPYRCSACRKYFSVRTGTAMEASNIPLRKWVICGYLMTTSLKGVSSMKISRDLDVSQPTAWFMVHRIREGWRDSLELYGRFEGPAEVDEAYIGGKERNKHASKRLNAGRGPVGKTAVVGIKDRSLNLIGAKVVERTDRPTLQNFVTSRTYFEATIYTDEARAYEGMPRDHETVRHSVGEYVDGMAHTNGMESFWSALKRGFHGVYHHMSPKHLQRYVNEFAGRHNDRERDTIVQMELLFLGMVGRRLKHEDLIGPPETRLT